MKRKDVLRAATEVVASDRNNIYGEPEDNFSSIAKLWEVYIRSKYCSDINIDLRPEDVAAMMILFKVGRITSGVNHDDSWIDIAGYAACGSEVCEK